MLLNRDLHPYPINLSPCVCTVVHHVCVSVCVCLLRKMETEVFIFYSFGFYCLVWGNILHSKIHFYLMGQNLLSTRLVEKCCLQKMKTTGNVYFIWQTSSILLMLQRIEYDNPIQVSLYDSFYSPQELWNIPAFWTWWNQCSKRVPGERLSCSPGACWWKSHLRRLRQCIYKSKSKVWNNRPALQLIVYIWVWLPYKTKPKGWWFGICMLKAYCAEEDFFSDNVVVPCCICMCKIYMDMYYLMLFNWS